MFLKVENIQTGMLINCDPKSRDLGSRGVTAPARFTLALIRRGRIIHGATYFDDDCQPPRHGFPWARCQDMDGRTVNNHTAQTDGTDAHRTNYTLIL